MAIVETLEIRFVAKLGNLGSQIAAITGALAGISAATGAAMASVSGASHLAKKALDGVGLSTLEAGKKQSDLAARLKKTGRALKNVSKQARKAAEGIGLHKMDEINLVGDQKKSSSSSSGGGGSSASGGSGTSAALPDFGKLKKAFESIEGFFTRFHGHLKRNMRSLDSWIDRLTGGLAGDMVRSLGTLGRNAAQSLTDSLFGRLNIARPAVANEGRTLIQTLGDALRNGAMVSTAPDQAGMTLTDKLKNGILGGRPSIKNAAASVTASAKFGGEAAKNEAKSAGANLSSGLAEGILSKLKKVRDAAARIANAALSKLKGILKIASPSKVAFKMGGFFGEGFAGGIRSSVRSVGSGAADLANAAALRLNVNSPSIGAGSDLSAMVRAAVGDALGDASIVVPINVDGIKLGEAAIRGINRVTRASGRLMLEI